MAENRFDPAEYWERRLAGDYGLGAVGYIGLGEGFNRWMYAVRRRVFRDSVNASLEGANRRELHVLDVGSGTGFYVDLWRELGVVDVTASDLTARAVENLRSKVPEMSVQQLDIGDEAITVAGAPFDAISVMDVLFHIVDDERYERAIVNLAGLIKPDGLLIMSENLVPSDERREHVVSRSQEEVVRQLNRAGLQVTLRRPMFFLMNQPISSTSRALRVWWHNLIRVAERSERLGWVVGATVFPAELALVRNAGSAPSTQILVCRRRTPANP